MTNYIWNHFIAGKCVEGTTFVEAFNPSAGTPISKVAAGTSADVEHAVAAAEAALPEWRERKPMERGRVLLKIAAALREKMAELGTIEIAETGKPAWQAPFELELAAQYFEFYGGLVNVFQGEVIDLGSGYHSYTRREPYGVVGVITPWNAPLNQAARGIAPALAAGNVVVAKPSEFTSGTTVQLARIASECGLPDGVLNVVLGTGPDVGEAIVRNARVRKIAFTGSQRAGREIGKIAAERIIPLTLELGGKSPNIVFEDANLKEAVPGAIRAFAGNAGQVCLAGTRLLVQNSIHDVFVQHLVAGLSQVKVGKAPDSIVGPLTTKAQYDRVVEFFEIAKADGATVAAGGSVEGPRRLGRRLVPVPNRLYRCDQRHAHRPRRDLWPGSGCHSVQG